MQVRDISLPIVDLLYQTITSSNTIEGLDVLVQAHAQAQAHVVDLALLVILTELFRVQKKKTTILVS